MRSRTFRPCLAAALAMPITFAVLAFPASGAHAAPLASPTTCSSLKGTSAVPTATLRGCTEATTGGGGTIAGTGPNTTSSPGRTPGRRRSPTLTSSWRRMPVPGGIRRVQVDRNGHGKHGASRTSQRISEGPDLHHEQRQGQGNIAEGDGLEVLERSFRPEWQVRNRVPGLEDVLTKSRDTWRCDGRSALRRPEDSRQMTSTKPPPV